MVRQWYIKGMLYGRQWYTSGTVKVRSRNAKFIAMYSEGTLMVRESHEQVQEQGAPLVRRDEDQV